MIEENQKRANANASLQPIVAVVEDYFEGHLTSGIKPTIYPVGARFSGDLYQIAYTPGKKKEVIDFLRNLEYKVYGSESSRSAPLRELSPLRTVRASFPAYGSSNMTVIGFDADKAISFTTFMLINLLFNYTFATGMYKCPHFSSIDNLLGDAPRSFTVYTFSTNRAYFILSFPNVY